MSNDFHDAWHYLCEHDLFSHPEHGQAMSAFPASLYIEVVKVSPETKEIEGDEALNTETNVWLEAGGWVWNDINNEFEVSHDYRIDAGGSTFEEAVTTMAYILKELNARDNYYGH